VRLSVLVFGVLLVHSLPEGLAIGTAYAFDRAGLSAFVILAIGLQNVPEGTSVAVSMEIAGFGRLSQFWAAVLTSAPQPFGAIAAYLLVEHVAGLLPVSFGFAAGAMLALVISSSPPRPSRVSAGWARARGRPSARRSYLRSLCCSRCRGRAATSLRKCRNSSTAGHGWRDASPERDSAR
jgi:ZIP family zinc transporter